MHHHAPHARAGQPLRHGLGHAFGVAVHGAVGHHHAVFQRLVTAHFVVHLHDAGQVLAPYGPVGAAHGGEGLARHLLQGLLHGRAVLAHDVGVVAHHLVPIGRNVHVGIKHRAVERAEATEGVAGEEHAVGEVERHHRLGPVHHGGEVEAQFVAAEGEGVAVAHLEGVAGQSVITFDHGERLGVAHQHHVGEVLAQQADGAGMVGLHVVDDEIVEGLPGEDGAYLGDELVAGGRVDGVDQGGLAVCYQIGVVGHAEGQGEHVLELVFLAVVHAHVGDVARNELVVHNRFAV